MLRRFSAFSVSLIALISLVFLAPEAEAHKHHSTSSSHASRSTHSTSRQHRGRVTHTEVASSGRHRGRHHRGAVAHHRGRHGHAAPKTAGKPKYAYPLELFMMSPPEFDKTPLAPEQASKLRKDFERGIADRHPPNDLVRAGIVSYYPLHGGIFKRREQVKYIIVHSTETGPPVSAQRVIDAWGSLGRRHAGAQYVVERDGTIYQSCEPDLATVHVNIFKTLPGINNDNSIGIEMNHTGRQIYPLEQRESVKKLVAYLQDRYHVVNENIITHRYAQQGDHTDPVAFDFEAFLATKEDFHLKALAMKRDLGIPSAPPQFVETTVQTADIMPPMAPDTTALTTKGAITIPPTAPDTVPFVPEPAGAPLPGPAVLRKELELNPGDAAMDQKMEQELEPMQNNQPEQVP